MIDAGAGGRLILGRINCTEESLLPSKPSNISKDLDDECRGGMLLVMGTGDRLELFGTGDRRPPIGDGRAGLMRFIILAFGE